MVYSRDKKIKIILFLVLILILASSLCIYHLSFFEFKNDQLDAIHLGNDARNAHFLITHGLRSGVGFDNPPLFIWFMGIITAFTQNPLYLTAVFTFFNILALILAIRYFYINLPRVYALLSSILLAFSPAFIMYSNIIWAQCLLPFIMILFHINFYRFIREEKTSYFILLGILAIFASQLHLTGFFLFPLILILAIYYRSKIKKSTFIITSILVSIAFLPYLYHLIFEKEFIKLLNYLIFAHKTICWKVFREHLRIASFDFFRYYFRYDFNAVLDKSMGIFKFILYPLSWGLMLLFLAGLFYYIRWLIKGRKLFNINLNELDKYPLPFQISGFMVLFITLGYLIFRVRTPMHYLIIFYPSHSILMAFAAYRIWSFRWANVIITLSILSTIILLCSTLLFLRRSGGHYYAYGSNYNSLLKFKREVWSMVPKGYCPSLSIEISGKGKPDKDPISAVIMGDNECKDRMPLIPTKLIIRWNDHLMRYEHSISIDQNYNK